MDTAVIIPARDEAASIHGVVSGARAVLPGARIIVIDDASGDATARLALAAGADVITLRRRHGYAGALLVGYREVQRMPVDAVLQMDGDGQHRPEDLPRLIKGLGDADIVLGSRFLGASAGYRIPAPRRAGIAACRWMAVAVGGLRVTDPTSGLRAMTPAAAVRIATDGFPAGLTETSMLVHMHRAGFRIGEVPVRMRASTGRSMHAGLRGGTHFMRISWAVMGLAGARGARGPAADHPAAEAVAPQNAL